MSQNKKIKKTDDFGVLNVIVSNATFAQKMEAIRASNPYFYLLTPKPQPKKEKHHGL
jgi:hypothetical protein